MLGGRGQCEKVPFLGFSLLARLIIERQELAAGQCSEYVAECLLGPDVGLCCGS